MKHVDFLTGDREHDQRNVDVLLAAVEALYGREDLDALLREAVDHALLVTGAERGVLLLVEEGGAQTVRVARMRDGREAKDAIPYSRTWMANALRDGEVVQIGDSAGQPVSGLGTSTYGLRSVLAVRLGPESKPVGVLYVDSKVAAKFFQEGDLAVFKALAGLVATAIEKAERRRLEEEMRVARQIQLSLKPRGPAAPRGFDVAFDDRPALATSGDYYDVIPMTDGRVALVVADVCGKGLPAALFSVSVRSLVRSLLRAWAEPATVLDEINAVLAPDLPAGQFVTLFLGILDPKTAVLSWAGAGHDPPLHWSDGRDLVELLRTGPPLGIFPDARYEAGARLTLEPGEALVLYTDGIFGCHGHDGEIYGEERFRGSLAKHAAGGSDAATLLRGLFADLFAFVGTRPTDDDVTCVVVRRTTEAVVLGAP